jgi:hypothetical protein
MDTSTMSAVLSIVDAFELTHNSLSIEFVRYLNDNDSTKTLEAREALRISVLQKVQKGFAMILYLFSATLTNYSEYMLINYCVTQVAPQGSRTLTIEAVTLFS